MAEFTLISPRGSRLSLTHSEHFKLIEIDGQTAVDNSLYTVKTIGGDGDSVNSATTEPRTLTVYLYIEGNVELAKRHIMQYVKPKQKHSLEWEQENRTRIISGVCGAIAMPRWKNGIVFQFSLHCEQPYWEDAEQIVQEISEIIPLHYFTTEQNEMLYFDVDDVGIAMGEYDTARTKTFYNYGDVAVGVEIIVNALKTTTNPVIYASPDKFIGVTGVTLQAGETLTITTMKGNKDILKDGVSIIGNVKQGSTWLQLETGDNTFTIDSDETEIDNMYFEIIYSQRYV